MASFFNDLNGNNVAQLKGMLKHRVSTKERLDLGKTLGPEHEGLFVWDTDEKRSYDWNGSDWQ